MKWLSFLFVFIALTSSLLAQDERIPDKQFMLGCTNVGSSEEVTHYIEALGEVWQYDDGPFVTGGVYSSSLVTTGNADFNSYNWPGFNFNWLNGEPYWSLGLYKVTNSKQTDKYFYLDARDSDFGVAEYNPDFFIYFNNSDGKYYFRYTNDSISQGEVVRVWKIHDESPNTSGLQSYWSNVLVGVASTDDLSPRLIWGPYSGFSVTGYKIYRSINTQGGGPGTFGLTATISNDSTFEWIDPDLALGSGWKVYYKVKAYNNSEESSYSNMIDFNSSGFYKQARTRSDILKSFTLNQNYPNPFNPITYINYIVKENSYISLKVYNILGVEIANLVNEIKEPGYHNVIYDALRLSSGVYFYTMKIDGYSITKKMQLVK